MLISKTNDQTTNSGGKMKTEIQDTELYQKFIKALAIRDMRADDNPFVVKCCEIAKEFASQYKQEPEKPLEKQIRNFADFMRKWCEKRTVESHDECLSDLQELVNTFLEQEPPSPQPKVSTEKESNWKHDKHLTQILSCFSHIDISGRHTMNERLNALRLIEEYHRLNANQEQLPSDEVAEVILEKTDNCLRNARPYPLLLTGWHKKNIIAIIKAEINSHTSSAPQVQKEETLLELFKLHQDFAKHTFPESSWVSSLRGLEREIKEVEKEASVSSENWYTEYVDCMMYLIDSMQRAGVEWPVFERLFRRKYLINKERKWAKNKDGSYSHI